jgi:general secretion pathway protein A
MNSPELAHFGLTCNPFSKSIADSDLWLPTSKAGIVDQLVSALEARECILLDGEAGVGKTCILRALRQKLPESRFRLTYCANALNLSPKATAASVFNEVARHVKELADERCHPVLLLDEAHLIHQDVLDHLHILCNYEWDRQPLLSLILVGLPELRDRLMLRHQRSLYSRISHRIRIPSMTPDDTAEYLHHRLQLAGNERQIFTDHAIAMLYEAAGGTNQSSLRDFDRLASAAIVEAHRRKKKLVEHDIVHHVAQIDNLQ